MSLSVTVIGAPAARAAVRRALERAGIDVAAEGDTPADLAGDEGAVIVIDESAETGLARMDGIETLTPREREVLDLLAEGFSNRTMAERLGISEHTVKFHVTSIYGKLGASSRAQAIRRAARRGLITI